MKKFLIPIILIALVSSCKNNEDKKAPTEQVIAATKTNDRTITLTDVQIKNSTIKTEILSQKSINNEIIANGYVTAAPESIVSASAPLGGFMKKSNVMIGTYVNKGQAIATLEDEQYIQLQQDYLLTKANIQYSAQDLERQQILNRSKAVSDKQYQQASRDYQMDKIKLQSLAAKLRLININPSSLSVNNISNTVNLYAPISGYISKINFTVGSYISPSIPVFEIVNNNNIYITAKIFEKDLNQVRVGQQLIAYRNEQPDKKYFCNVRSIEQGVNEDRTVNVIASISNADEYLKNGMYVNVAITTSSTEGIAVPLEAVLNYEGRDWVFVAVGNHQYELTPIVIINSDTKQVVIQDNESIMNKPIVTQNAYTLLMALKNVEEE